MNSWFFKSMIWLVLLLLVLLLFVLPVLTSLMLANGYRPPVGMEKYLDWIQTIQIKVMHVFTLAWIFFLGSCFASFLNVVAWRVPRGKSILGSSHCPHCNLELTFRDNVPIVGWLKNGGRCSSCRTPITVRYLIAELILGAVYLALFLREVVTGGANLPVRPTNRFAGIENILFDPDWTLLAIYGFHLILLSTLFTFAMIASEKRRAPYSIFGFTAIVGLAFLLISPHVNIVNWRLGETTGSANSYGYSYLNFSKSNFDFLIALAMGIVAAILASLAISFSTGERRTNDKPLNRGLSPVLAAMLLTGIFLGWQTVVSIAAIYFLITACILFLVSFDKRYRVVNSAGRILLATLVHLMCWRPQMELEFWSGPTATSTGALCCAVGIILSALAFSRFADFLDNWGRIATDVRAENQPDS